MNVQASNLVLIFGPETEAGKDVRVLWPFDISESVGHRSVVRMKGEGECVVPDSSLMYLDVDPRGDPGARDLLDAAGQQAWDRWFAPPNVDF